MFDVPADVCLCTYNSLSDVVAFDKVNKPSLPAEKLGATVCTGKSAYPLPKEANA